eukprot:6900-Amphidinium_carterae.2
MYSSAPGSELENHRRRAKAKGHTLLRVRQLSRSKGIRHRASNAAWQQCGIGWRPQVANNRLRSALNGRVGETSPDAEGFL